MLFRIETSSAWTQARIMTTWIPRIVSTVNERRSNTSVTSIVAGYVGSDVWPKARWVTYVLRSMKIRWGMTVVMRRVAWILVRELLLLLLLLLLLIVEKIIGGCIDTVRSFECRSFRYWTLTDTGSIRDKLWRRWLRWRGWMITGRCGLCSTIVEAEIACHRHIGRHWLIYMRIVSRRGSTWNGERIPWLVCAAFIFGVLVAVVVLTNQTEQRRWLSYSDSS